MSKHALPLSMSFPPKGKMDAIDGIQMLEKNGFDAIDFTLNTFHDLYGDGWREIGYRGHFNFELKFRYLPLDTIPAALGFVRAIGENMTAQIVSD